MGTSWAKYCRARDLEVIGESVKVKLPDGRTHTVRVTDAGDAFRMTATVVRAAVARNVEDLAVLTWRRNRGTELVGFSIDDSGRLIGVCWVPKLGLTRTEFQLYARTLAGECDRYEYELTGQDR